MLSFFLRVLKMDSNVIPHEFIFIDKAGFNLTWSRRRRNIIGHRAILNVPSQPCDNITMCAAVTQNGVPHRNANLGPYNTAHILTFLDRLHSIVTTEDQMDAVTCIKHKALLTSKLNLLFLIGLDWYIFVPLPASQMLSSQPIWPAVPCSATSAHWPARAERIEPSPVSWQCAGGNACCSCPPSSAAWSDRCVGDWADRTCAGCGSSPYHCYLRKRWEDKS